MRGIDLIIFCIILQRNQTLYKRRNYATTCIAAVSTFLFDTLLNKKKYDIIFLVYL